jgi:plastocyanin
MNKSTKRIQRLIAFTAITIWSCSTVSHAATAVVQVGTGGDHFVPAVTNINVGDRVIWNWTGPNHNTVSTNGLWGSATMGTGTSFTNTFNNAGAFGYVCTIHASFGMTGTINVSGGAANVPPIVSITNLSPGAVFAAPANVTIRAMAADSDGSVTNVQFRVGATAFGNATVAPYAATTNNLPAGNYTLSAVASDNKGAMTTNSVAISVVTPAAIVLTSFQQLTPSIFRFTYTANAGLRYVVQRSTDLTASIWTSLTTNTAAGSSVDFTNSSAPSAAAFYRVGRLPNPNL